jgi:glycosyltransferase involved in cell wall biosynthesis
MDKKISIVIPNYNGAKTIDKCLEAAFSTDYQNFEVIVVDDCSDDNSVDIIKQFPCKLIRLEQQSGASKARNTGGRNSSGDIIFFTDADCLIQPDTLSIINSTYDSAGPDIVVGGTYTEIPYDKQFCSIFQSIFVNYSETREIQNPDYIAAHAMCIYTETFNKSGGFPEVFLPIMEDLEYTHRLRRSGIRLRMNPDIQVRHIYNFSLPRSIRNAFKKTRYWVMYSRENKDMLTDSGTASYELKFNVCSFFVNISLVSLWIIFSTHAFLIAALLITLCNLFISRKMFDAFYRAKGIAFAGAATLFYLIVYPLPIGAGTVAGIMSNFHRN